MIFGPIVCGAGFLGVILGSSLAQYFRKYDARADPLVCAAGIFLAVPLIFLGLLLARSFTSMSWILLFLAVTALSTNWAVVSDMLLSVTLPSKRSFATAIQILVTHLLGDAASPSITGDIRDRLEKSTDEYDAFLYALLSTLIVLMFGAIAFLFSCKHYVGDVDKCNLPLNRSSRVEEPTEAADLTNFASN